MRDDVAAILDACHRCIGEECPESERGVFLQFATDQLHDIEARLASEKSAWPAETDCDRLDRVEAALRDRGILLWQVSPCCDTCTLAELPDRIDVINRRHSGFLDRVRGYAFFIEQDMPEMLPDSTELPVYIGYGYFSPDDSKVSKDAYMANALGIAREVSECLKREGFEVEWDGKLGSKLYVSINWQRRGMLD